MLIFKVILSISGEEFSPARFIEHVKLDKFLIFDSNEPNELIWENRNDRYEFGSISICDEKQFCLKHEFDSFEKALSNFFLGYKKDIIELGADSIIYNIDVFYTDLCSFELSSSENYKCFEDFSFSIPINVYKITEQELIQSLLEANYDMKFIQEYQW